MSKRVRARVERTPRAQGSWWSRWSGLVRDALYEIGVGLACVDEVHSASG